MRQITISSGSLAPRLRERLFRHVGALARDGAGVAITESEAGEYTHFTCTLDAPGEGAAAAALEEVLRASAAQAVAETVVRDVTPELVAAEMRALLAGRGEGEVAGVLASLDQTVSGLAGHEALEHIAAAALECLWERDALHLDGFVRFRLGEYREKLKESVRLAVRRAEAGREQQEFVKLLAYLIEQQESSIDELHIYPDSGYSFKLRDKSGSSVDSDYLETYVWDLAREGNVDREDLLISALVSLAPGRVHWHLDRAAWKSPLLEKILGRRLVYCTGCDRCTPALN